MRRGRRLATHTLHALTHVRTWCAHMWFFLSYSLTAVAAVATLLPSSLPPKKFFRFARSEAYSADIFNCVHKTRNILYRINCWICIVQQDKFFVTLTCGIGTNLLKVYWNFTESYTQISASHFPRDVVLSTNFRHLFRIFILLFYVISMSQSWGQILYKSTRQNSYSDTCGV